MYLTLNATSSGTLHCRKFAHRLNVWLLLHMAISLHPLISILYDQLLYQLVSDVWLLLNNIQILSVLNLLFHILSVYYTLREPGRYFLKCFIAVLKYIKIIDLSKKKITFWSNFLRNTIDYQKACATTRLSIKFFGCNISGKNLGYLIFQIFDNITIKLITFP